METEETLLEKMNQLVEQLRELNKKKFYKTSSDFGVLWTAGYLFTVGFVPSEHIFKELSGFWEIFGALLFSYFVYPVVLGSHLNELLSAIAG